MKAVILAAGNGTRLRPFTHTRPKPLVPIAGKSIISRLTDSLNECGINDFVVVIDGENDKKKIREEIRDKNIEFVKQEEGQGTGAALLAAKNKVDDDFLVVAGDTVVEPYIIRKVKNRSENDITVAVKKVDNPHEYGVVELTQNNKISLVEEKPNHPKTDLANLSVYRMSPSVFDDLENLSTSERGEKELTDLLVGEGAVEVDGYWKDIAYPWDMLEANQELLDNADSKQGQIEESTIKGNVIMEEGAKIIDSYVEGVSYIGENTVIGPNAYLRGYNSIGSNCSIAGGSTVKNSILFDDVYAKHLTYIGDSVIGESVNFGSGTQIANFRFDGDNVNVKTSKGWKNTGRRKVGAFVGDNVKFGVLSCTMPGKIIGPNSWIFSGVVINKNVPRNKKAYTRNEVEFKDLDE